MRYELGNLMGENLDPDVVSILSYRLNAITAERDQLLNEVQIMNLSAIHSCSENCKRVMCVLRRERDELKARLEQVMLHPEDEVPWKEEIINNIL